ncbi:DUF996 domain-containing protein [bacterium]|nr:DUF996 domain-containing protein [bacterium]
MVNRIVEIRSAKLMGGIGAILEIVGGFIPYLDRVLPFAGLILVLIALKKLSDATNTASIFKDFLVSAIFMAIGNVLLLLAGAANLAALFQKGLNLFHLGALFIALILAWVVTIIGAYFLKLSFNSLAGETGVDLFETAGNIIFIGALLAIIFVGVLVVLVGRIVEIIAFFALPDTLEITET